MAMAAAAAIHNSNQRKRLSRVGSDAADIERVFNEFDEDGSGDIDKKELSSALTQLGVVGVTPTTLDEFIRICGGDKDSLGIEEFDKLVVMLREKQTELAKEARAKRMGIQAQTKVLPFQDHVRLFYNNPIVMWSVAGIIIANFLINIIEKEIDPTGLLHQDLWNGLDVLFNSIFLVELLLNMYGYGGPRRPFWKSGWNVFDTFIVGSSLVPYIPNTPEELSKLKLLRAFRVFRLFKRVESLNKIINAILRCIPGVLNAFLIMIIFFCIYAILAVDLFSDFGASGEYTTWDDSGPINVTSLTQRGFTNGYEYYGTFSRAMYTLFQVMTGESWSEAVARPLIFGFDRNAIVATVFFVSFVLIMQFVLINVVVAVLLDKFVTEEPSEEIDAKEVLAGAPAGAPAASSNAEVDVHVGAPPPPQPLPPPPGTPPTPQPLPGTLPESTDAKLDLLMQQMMAMQVQLDSLVRRDAALRA